MNRRDARIGMEIRHKSSGEVLGTIRRMLNATVTYDGGPRGLGVAAYGEIEPVRE